jgi:SAM-dependent methyltransferase
MFLLSCGLEKAAEEALPVAFVRGDARHTGFHNQRFHFILLMGSSFGYILDENENLKILTEAYRLLATEGRLFLDLPDKNYVIKNFKPFAHHRVDDQVEVIRKRQLEKDVIYCREKVLNAAGDRIRENVFCTRLYSRKKIQKMLHTAGFKDVLFETDFMHRGNTGDFGCMTNRMLVMAGKAD